MWANKTKGLHFLQMFAMSNVVYIFAVIEDGYAAWDKIHKKSAQQGQDEDSTRDGDANTRIVEGKYTSHSGSKRQCSNLGWNQDGVVFYNWVKMGWKKQRLDRTRRQMDVLHGRDQTWDLGG